MVDDLEFLARWRAALWPLLDFINEDEPVAGTLHGALRCLRFDLFDMETGIDDSAFGFSIDRPTRYRELLLLLREAVELIGLALHYDKRAWAWLHANRSDEFLYEADPLEPLFEFSFHNNYLGDRYGHVRDGMKILMDTAGTELSGEYRVAKYRLRRLAGRRFDPQYRIAVAFVLAPAKIYPNLYMDTSLQERREALVQFARTVTSPAYRDASCFEFMDMTLFLWERRVDKHIEAFLSELQIVGIPLREVAIRLTHTQVISAGIVTNVLCGFGLDAGDGLASSLVREVSLHESRVLPFVNACTSLMHAKSPERLVLYEAFGDDFTERATKWQWLGFALSAWDTSIQHVRIEEDKLSTSDVRHFVGDLTNAPYCIELATPSIHSLDAMRCG